MKRSALLIAFVPMTTPGGAHGANANWAKVVRAAQKVGRWWGEEHGGSQRAVLCSTHGSF